MSKKKQKEIRLSELTEEEKMKYEVAEELGLLDKVLKEGWRSLTSKETKMVSSEQLHQLNTIQTELLTLL